MRGSGKDAGSISSSYQWLYVCSPVDDDGGHTNLLSDPMEQVDSLGYHPHSPPRIMEWDRKDLRILASLLRDTVVSGTTCGSWVFNKLQTVASATWRTKQRSILFAPVQYWRALASGHLELPN
ncbi:unnamed protein product [Callosobruchus maculatus]|uniref:Uncharacterized protein n=1 Tax=Callosobruchus maculatus TaxID=64391 RepID=A0A653BUF0_CALMS|nr:unnamed protein product [Callosobruchus maculatus]